MKKADTYAIVIKTVPEGNSYRFAIMVVNRASDHVILPENNNFKRNELAKAITRARELQAGTLRCVHLALSGYAGRLSVVDKQAVADMSGIQATHQWTPVDEAQERLNYYMRPSQDDEAHALAQDIADNASMYEGII